MMIVKSILNFFSFVRPISSNPRLTNSYGNPLPKNLHIELDVKKNQRTIIIGDIHGCLEELKLLFEKCRFDPVNDIVVFVGDLVNKGPYSTDVIKFVRGIHAYSVRGNHDESALSHALKHQKRQQQQQENNTSDKEKNKNTDNDSKNEKYKYVEEWSNEDIEWLQELPYTIRIPAYNAIVVHAGLVPGIELEKQDPLHMVTMRNLIIEQPSSSSSSSDQQQQQRLHMYKAIEGHKEGTEWAKVWSDEITSQLVHSNITSTDTTTVNSTNVNTSTQHTNALGVATVTATNIPSSTTIPTTSNNNTMHVYFGHDAKRGLQFHSYATGLDTGVCYGRELSAMILPSNELVQVKALHVYQEPKEPKKKQDDNNDDGKE